jgi:hypothetical protein
VSRVSLLFLSTRDRLRARQETLKQQRLQGSSSSSSLTHSPVPSRVPSPPLPTSSAAPPSTLPAAVTKKFSILDTLDDDSFSSQSTAANQSTTQPVTKIPEKEALKKETKSIVQETNDDVQSFNDDEFDF